MDEFDEYAYILDILPQGRMEEKIYRRVPLALAIGEKNLKLLELIPKQGAVLTIGDRVYIGREKEKRDKIESVRGRINYNQLTPGAQNELEYILRVIVENNQERFINFFNNAQPITNRLHQLDLLYGVGKNMMWEIIDERKKGPFKDFQDLKARVKGLRDPEKMIVERIIRELKNKDEKYKIFVAR